MRKWAAVFSALILIVAAATTVLLRWHADHWKGLGAGRMFRPTHHEPRVAEEIPMTVYRAPRPGTSPAPNARYVIWQQNWRAASGERP